MAPSHVVGVVAPSSISSGLLRRVPCFKPLSESVLQGLLGWVRPLLVNKTMVEHMKRRGKMVFMLGVNDEEMLALSMRTGCSAVLTDRVEWLQGVLAEMKELKELQKVEKEQAKVGKVKRG